MEDDSANAVFMNRAVLVTTAALRVFAVVWLLFAGTRAAEAGLMTSRMQGVVNSARASGLGSPFDDTFGKLTTALWGPPIAHLVCAIFLLVAAPLIAHLARGAGSFNTRLRA